jgi:hypothetical protein
VVKVVDFKPLATAVGWNHDREFGFFHVRKLSASLQNVSGSTHAQKGT